MSSYRPDQDDFDVITATTMCALDFYEGRTPLSQQLSPRNILYAFSRSYCTQ